MSDTQAAMREFRFLDETRKSNGLTPAEEQRWYELAQSLGVDVGQPQPHGYYADDGNWYPYPEGYDPATGQYAAQVPAYQPHYPPQPQGWYPPPQQPQGYYGQDGNWYPYPPGYDPVTGQYYPGYGPPQPSYPPQPSWPPAPSAQGWPQPSQPQPQYDHTTGQWGYPAYPVPPPVEYPPAQDWPPPAPEAQPDAAAPTGITLDTQPAVEMPAYDAEPVTASAPLPAVADAPALGEAPAGGDSPLEVSSDEVMEVGDDELSPVASPPSSPSKVGEDPVNSLRDALAFEDPSEITANGAVSASLAEVSAARTEAPPPIEPPPAELEPEPVAPPVLAEPAQSLLSGVPEVPADFGSLEDAAPLSQDPVSVPALAEAPSNDPAPSQTALPDVSLGAAAQFTSAELPSPKPFDDSLDDAPTRVYPATARKAEAERTSPVAATPPEFAAPSEAPFETSEAESPTSLTPMGLETDPPPTSPRLFLELPVAELAEPAAAFGALGDSADDAPPTTIEHSLSVPAFSDIPPLMPELLAGPSEPTPAEAYNELPALTPPATLIKPMSALDSLAIGPEVPIGEPELPLVEALSVEADPMPVPEEPSEVPTPATVIPLAETFAPSRGSGIKSSPSGFKDWSSVPIVESPAMQVVEAQAAQLDDAPIPEEAPIELGGDSSDRLPVASTSDFVSYANQTEQLDVSFEETGDFLVDSSTLASLATGLTDAPAAPMAEEKLELASAADFIDHASLTSTGEKWSNDRGVALEQEQPAPLEEEGDDIVQGIVLEDDAPIPVPELSPPPPPSAPKHTELAWESTRPSPPPMPFAKVSPSSIQAFPPPPAPVAPPSSPPQPATLVMPASAFAPPSPPPPPLVTKVATPISSRPSPVPVPAPVADPFDRSGLSLGGAEPVQILVPGEHRVILHTVEGQVKRGSIRDANLGADILVLEGAALENLPRARVKAIFFMLAPGARAPTTEGEKVRVTFKDGRQVAGFSKDQKDATLGFFVVPADNRTNTERIFIYRHAVQAVLVE